jgi:hypothetical protein
MWNIRILNSILLFFFCQPENIQNSTGLNERKAVSLGGLESNGSVRHHSVDDSDNVQEAVIFKIP